MNSQKSAVLAKCEELAPFVDSPIGVSSCIYDPSLQKCNIRHPRWRMVLSESVIIISDKLPDYHPLWNLAAEILGIEDEQAAKDRELVSKYIDFIDFIDATWEHADELCDAIKRLAGLEVENG